ncbi:BrnT family toxin [Burkholderia alba]|uniref:BrnT family toxin n=1 Tax=Burkholderia alba TaxID=2683677 RepID=UPI002B05BB8A|nr:BrnT family toxin [Burkholderia alba]
MFSHPHLFGPILEFDAAKCVANEVKHGVSFALAARVDGYPALIWLDVRRGYGEERYIAIAPIGARLYVAVFVIRGRILRIITLRKANTREVKRYAKQA